jgi:hypothetical protein
MTVFNVEPYEQFIQVTHGDTIDLSFSVALNAVAYDMTGMQLDMKIKNKKGTSVKTLSSAGTSPAITISTTTFNISTTAFADAGMYDYDIQLTDGSDVMTIMYGKIDVTKQIT